MSASGISCAGSATEADHMRGSTTGDRAGATGSEFLNCDDVLGGGSDLTVARCEANSDTLIFIACSQAHERARSLRCWDASASPDSVAFTRQLPRRRHGAGTDILTGGAGLDTFVFVAVSDSVVGINRDVITDFVHPTDKITLTAIDANATLGGDQAFAFVGAQTSATVANSVTWQQTVDGGGANITIVRADIDGNVGNGPEMEIQLTGHINLTAADFNL